MVLSESEVCEKEVNTATVSAEPPKVIEVSPTIVAAIVTMAACQLGGQLGQPVKADPLTLLLLVAFKDGVFDQGGGVLVG
jgi:hypothetical protein